MGPDQKKRLRITGLNVEDAGKLLAKPAHSIIKAGS